MRMGIRNPKGPRPESSYYKMWRDMFALPFLDGQTFDLAGVASIASDPRHVPTSPFTWWF